MSNRSNILAPARVMARAWAIFRERYNYPCVPFRSLGWGCFRSALKLAWSEARITLALVAKHTADELRGFIADLKQPCHAVGLSTSYALSGAAQGNILTAAGLVLLHIFARA